MFAELKVSLFTGRTARSAALSVLFLLGADFSVFWVWVYGPLNLENYEFYQYNCH